MPAIEPGLDDLHQQEVGDRKKRDRPQQRQWQRSEPQQAAQRRVRQHGGDGDDGQHADQQRPAGAALERVACRPDHKYHQRLRRQGFHEPSGVEERRVRGSVEHPEQHPEREEIIDRADGADDHHELANEPNLPSLGPVQQGGIHIVAGDADLRNVVKKVVQQDLRRQHGQEWQEERCRGHAEHVSEVRARAHDDVLHDVGEAAPPLDDPVVQDRKVLFQQDDLRGVLRHLHAIHDGNADIRGVQRRSIVDAVADVPDDVPACFQSEDDPVLLFRRHAGEDGAVLRLVGQSGIVHRVDLVAGDDAVGCQPHVVGDLLGHILVVAGHDDHGDAILLQRFENGKNPLLGRVEEGREPGQRHVLFGRQRVGILLVHLPHCDPKSAVPVGAQLLEGLRRLSSPAFVERLGNAIDGHGLADGEDALRLALGDEEALVAMPHHHGKALAVEVEGDLVHLLVLHDGRALVLQDRVVQRALDARLKVAVQVDEPQDVFVVLPLDVHVPVEHDLAFGQRARLIAAEDLDAAEVLDGRKLLDQDLLLGHPPRALGQRDRDDHRHHLRRHPDGKRDGEEERLQQRAVENDVHQQDEKHQQHDHPRDHQPEVAYAAAELGLRRPHGQPLGDLAEGGISCRCRR